MIKLLLKVSDCEFEIKFKTNRKTCPLCNGTGQMMDWDFGTKDECDLCLGGRQFIDSFMRNINNEDGNIFFFEKYLNKNDFIKVQLAHSLTSKCNRLDEYMGKLEQDDYKDNCIIIPHFKYVRPTILETKKKEERP
jgi:hypothetical protein